MSQVLLKEKLCPNHLKPLRTTCISSDFFDDKLVSSTKSLVLPTHYSTAMLAVYFGPSNTVPQFGTATLPEDESGTTRSHAAYAGKEDKLPKLFWGIGCPTPRFTRTDGNMVDSLVNLCFHCRGLRLGSRVCVCVRVFCFSFSLFLLLFHEASSSWKTTCSLRPTSSPISRRTFESVRRAKRMARPERLRNAWPPI